MVNVFIHDLEAGTSTNLDRLTPSGSVWIDLRPGCEMPLAAALDALRGTYNIPDTQVADVLHPPADIFPRIDHTNNMYCRLSSVHNTDLTRSRAHFILVPGALITLISDDLGAARADAENALYSRSGRMHPVCLFARMVEAVVTMVAPVLTDIDTQISMYEQATFNTVRQNVTADMNQCMQLHSLKRTLGALRQNSDLTHRCLKTIVTHIGDKAAVDTFEEVMNVSNTLINRIDNLYTAATELDTLMFNLSAYRSSVVSQVLTGVSVLFVPLTWWAGIYGTNFAIIPELTWGVESEDFHRLRPNGWPAGYAYFWAVMAAFCAVSVGLLRLTNVF